MTLALILTMMQLEATAPRGFATLETAFTASGPAPMQDWEGATSGRCYLPAYPDEAAPALLTIGARDGRSLYGVWGAQGLSGGKPDEAYFDRITPEHARAHVDDMFNGHAGAMLEARARPDGTVDGGVEGRMRFEARGLPSGPGAGLILVRILYWTPNSAPYADCVFFKHVWPN